MRSVRAGLLAIILAQPLLSQSLAQQVARSCIAHARASYDDNAAQAATCTMRLRHPNVQVTALVPLGAGRQPDYASPQAVLVMTEHRPERERTYRDVGLTGKLTSVASMDDATHNLLTPEPLNDRTRPAFEHSYAALLKAIRERYCSASAGNGEGVQPLR